MTNIINNCDELRKIGLSACVFCAGLLISAFTSAASWGKSAHFCRHSTPGVIMVNI